MRSEPQLSINFEDKLSDAHCNFEEQNEVLESSIIYYYYYLLYYYYHHHHHLLYAGYL